MKLFNQNIRSQIILNESPPEVIKNCFTKDEIKRLLDIEKNSSYLVNREDGRKAGLGVDGAIPERNIEKWHCEIKNILLPRLNEILGSFQISETEFPPHFFRVNFPTRIHADTGLDMNMQIYKQIMIPLEVCPKQNNSHTILFKNRWYGPASFFVGKGYDSSIKNNQGHLRDNRGDFVYIKNLSDFISIVKKNYGDVIDYNKKYFVCNKQLVEEVNLLINKARYNSVTSSHITNGIDFDREIYNTYLTHHEYEDLYDLEVEMIYKWNIGDMLVWDRTQLHSSDNFAINKNSNKTGLAVFTCKKN